MTPQSPADTVPIVGLGETGDPVPCGVGFTGGAGWVGRELSGVSGAGELMCGGCGLEEDGGFGKNETTTSQIIRASVVNDVTTPARTFSRSTM